MRYFLHYGHDLQVKNKLEKDIMAHFKSLDGLLIGENKLKDFKSDLDKKISELNALHPRCTPIKHYYDSGSYNRGIRIGGIYCITIYLYQVKSDF